MHEERRSPDHQSPQASQISQDQLSADLAAVKVDVSYVKTDIGNLKGDIRAVKDTGEQILTCLTGSKLTGPGLVKEVDALKDKIADADAEIVKAKIQLAKYTGGIILLGFLIEQGIRFVFPGTLK